MVEGGDLRYKVSMGKGGENNMKGRIYITNAFSLSMVKFDCIIRIKEISVEDVKKLLEDDFVSGVGHEATSQVLSELLEKEIQTNRIKIELEPHDKLIVFQLLERLPEGVVLSSEQIKNIKYKFFLVTIEKNE